MNKKKWKKFEGLVAKVQAELAPNASIKTNEKIIGKNSGIKREVDISIRQNIGNYPVFIAINCKDYKVPVDLTRVEATIKLMEDVGANVSVMVSASGFTETALAVGSAAGMHMYRLVDTNEHEWKADIKLPLICNIKYLKDTHFVISSLENNQINITNPTLLYNKGGNLIGKIEDLFLKWWLQDNNDVPIGYNEHIEFLNDHYFIISGDNLDKVKITANIQVEKQIYFSMFPLAKLSGFEDQNLKGRVITNKIILPIKFDDIKNNWSKIDNINTLKITPFVTIDITRVHAL